jgi:hypothetical protein
VDSSIFAIILRVCTHFHSHDESEDCLAAINLTRAQSYFKRLLTQFRDKPRIILLPAILSTVGNWADPAQTCRPPIVTDPRAELKQTFEEIAGSASISEISVPDSL